MIFLLLFFCAYFQFSRLAHSSLANLPPFFASSARLTSRVPPTAAASTHHPSPSTAARRPLPCTAPCRSPLRSPHPTIVVAIQGFEADAASACHRLSASISDAVCRSPPRFDSQSLRRHSLSRRGPGSTPLHQTHRGARSTPPCQARHGGARAPAARDHFQ